MSNQSYCRFRNTLSDLRDCYRNMAEPAGDEERAARNKLVELCKQIADEHGGESE